VRTCIKTLRKKIDMEGLRPVIKTVHGVGYKLEIAVPESNKIIAETTIES
jgi:DNA-binding winged helix-turn-helix (wHTH) protein